MKRLTDPATLLLVIAGLIAAYLLMWPVPVDPVGWKAPEARGLVDPFEANDYLGPARAIELAGHEGPEDIASPLDGFFYASTHGGRIIRFRPDGAELTTFADVGGRPLGIEFAADGALYVANAYLGLQRVSRDGAVELLVDNALGAPLVYTNDVAISDDGIIYFTESSSKFGAEAFGGTYPASLLDILEHGGHGRLFRFDPATKDLDVLIDDLNFANGVAISDDQRFVLVAETGHYRIWRHWLTGDSAGTSEVIIDNLPAFPDNINNGLQGRFWIGMVAPRVDILDTLSAKPFLRKVVQRLPQFVRPAAVPSTHVIAIDGDGDVLMNLMDTGARFPSVTGAFESRQAIYLSTLFGDRLPRLDKRDLMIN